MNRATDRIPIADPDIRDAVEKLMALCKEKSCAYVFIGLTGCDVIGHNKFVCTGYLKEAIVARLTGNFSAAIADAELTDDGHAERVH